MKLHKDSFNIQIGSMALKDRNFRYFPYVVATFPYRIKVLLFTILLHSM
jgi:hypothetical protein